MTPFIIAELAQGFEGSPLQASLLVKAAARAGADAAKLQLVYADELATSDYEHYALFRKLEMPDEVWRTLCELAHEEGIRFYLDVFGSRSLALAQEIGADGVKVHSTDMGNPGLLRAIGASGIADILLSVGGCSAREIDEALDYIGDKRAVLLLGFQGYPTPPHANQVSRLEYLRSRYASRCNVRLGFGDHADPETDLAFTAPAAALAYGASVIEKHLTLAPVLKLEDFESALSPEGFARFAKALRECAAALGQADSQDDFFGMHPAEKTYREKTRKHVVAARDIAAGATVQPDDVVLKRSTHANPITDTRLAIGLRARRGIAAGTALTAADLERQ
jgi:N,N'-diacetyllegionaminate synthase